jgi:hypothetical protein
MVFMKELEDGMLLIDPIRDMKGDVLIKEDTVITRSILIKLMGISTHVNSIVEPIKVARQV